MASTLITMIKMFKPLSLRGAAAGQQHTSVAKALDSGLTTLGDILGGVSGMKGLEEAVIGRTMLTSSWVNPHNFSFEVCGIFVNSPTRMTKAAFEALETAVSARRFITSIIEGSSPLHDWTAAEAVRYFVDQKVLAPVSKGRERWHRRREKETELDLETAQLEHHLPNCYAYEALYTFSSKFVAGGVAAIWDVPLPHEEGYTKSEVMDLVLILKAAEKEFYLLGDFTSKSASSGEVTELKPLFLPYDAATPRPQEDTADEERNFRWVNIPRWTEANTLVKIRCVVKDGLLTISYTAPLVETGPRGKDRAAERKILQKPLSPDWKGRPKLFPLAELPPLAEATRFLELLARRVEVLQQVPELARWLAAPGHATMVLHQMFETKSGKQFLEEVRTELMEYRDQVRMVLPEPSSEEEPVQLPAAPAALPATASAQEESADPDAFTRLLENSAPKEEQGGEEAQDDVPAEEPAEVAAGVEADAVTA
jgi:hypothetical protein